MKDNVFVFPDPYSLAERLAGELAEAVNDAASGRRKINIALSGGSTPQLLFSILGSHFSSSVKWEYAHFYWCDERCVPPVSGESNYGNAARAFFDLAEIPTANIHRIIGENDPQEEALRYADEILRHVESINALPVFDIMLLGIGEDGHTASVFPGDNKAMDSESLCRVAEHPLTKQKRITLTLPVINNAADIRFVVAGAAKAEVVSRIAGRQGGRTGYPAGLVNPLHGKLAWYLDREAARLMFR